MKYPIDGGGGTAGGDAGDAAEPAVTPEEISAALSGTGVKVPAAPVSDEGSDEEEANADEDNGDEAADNAAADDSDAGDDEGAEDDSAADADGEEAAPAADKPADTPAQDTPEAKDFSFTVEDANGQSYKVNPDDSLDEILAEFEPKNTGQLMEIVKQQMRAQDEKAAYDADIKADAEAHERQEQVAKIQEGWDSEIKQLTADKRLTGDESAVKERVDAVYKFMGEENTKRADTGKPFINSFEDALDKIEAKEAREAKLQADKAAKDAKRDNGALVGGSSAPATSSVPAYKAGSARNISEALRVQGLV